jgi:hypothetical protein
MLYDAVKKKNGWHFQPGKFIFSSTSNLEFVFDDSGCPQTALCYNGKRVLYRALEPLELAKASLTKVS